MADWPFSPPISPMEAEVAEELPPPPGWSYEPKWDGFRAVIWSRRAPGAGIVSGHAGASGAKSAAAAGTDAAGDAGAPRLDSRNGKPLLRYFPELEPALATLPPGTVADGEVVVVIDGRLDFDALQNRIHPAASRIQRLARETPARLALFDLLALDGEDLRSRPLIERRRALEELAETLGVVRGSEHVDPRSPFLLSPSTRDLHLALRWFFEFEPAGFDGVVAKPLDRPYAEGKREMIKLKHRRTVDCVVGGYRVHKHGKRVGSILLGLHDDNAELHFIGHCSSFSEKAARELLETLRSLEAGRRFAADEPAGGAEAPASRQEPPGFGEHARRPGAPSRWSGGKDLGFIAVPPVLVVEVSYDQLTGDRFRHGARFERWRPDKEPRQCTLDQLERPRGADLVEALAAGLAGRPITGGAADGH